MGEWGNGEMGQWRNRVTAGPIPPFLHHPIPPFGRVIDGSLYRTGLPFVPPRRHEAVSEGRTLLHGEVRNREAQFSAGTAREDAEGEAGRLRPSAPREAEGQADLRSARGPVPPLLRDGGADPRHHRRDVVAASRAQ